MLVSELAELKPFVKSPVSPATGPLLLSDVVLWFAPLVDANVPSTSLGACASNLPRFAGEGHEG